MRLCGVDVIAWLNTNARETVVGFYILERKVETDVEDPRRLLRWTFGMIFVGEGKLAGGGGWVTWNGYVRWDGSSTLL